VNAAPTGRAPRLSAFIAFLVVGPLAVAAAEPHPRLLITAQDVPRLRHLCGTRQAAETGDNWGRFGRSAPDFQTLRAHATARVGAELLPGELTAAAFLHVVDPNDPADASRLAVINAALLEPASVTTDPLEITLALDWCWDRLDPAARREFLLAARKRAEPLAPADSPLEPERFRQKLAMLALALVVDEADDPNPAWAALRSRLIDAARKYFETTFPTYVAWRGLTPTSPAVAARQECDTVLAIELANRVLERDAWPDHRPTVGRWLEHYVLVTVDRSAPTNPFVRDDGDAAPLSPAAWHDLLPVTAHLLAARTRDPAAALVADRVEAALRNADDPLAPLWRWVPIVLDTADIPRCNPQRLPAARNLGGAVVFRGGSGADATVVWIEAGQPFLARRQHFDAGHFLIYRGGRLAVDGGDDVALEAVRSKEGEQRLGSEKEPFDFEQYFTASIAHNCLVLWDAARTADWYKVRYRPAGGQRCIEGTCADFATPLAAQGRQTGRQLAYGQRDSAAYVALDLAPAYDSRAISAYTREFIFCCGRALVVVDRVSLPASRSMPTWILNVPSRPRVDGQELRDEARVAGSTSQAGVWRYDQARWLRWSDGDGGLWLTAPLPAARALRVVGGPARKLVIGKGPYAGQTYVGGDADGFERLIIPAEHHGALNAWYRLGQPALLGPQFGKTPHWGRIEIEPVSRDTSLTFLTVLVTDRAADESAPSAEFEQTEDALVLKLRAGEDHATLRLPAGMARGGTLDVGGPAALSWTLPADVAADAALR